MLMGATLEDVWTGEGCMAGVDGLRVRPAGAEICRFRYEEGADEAKESFNQSNQAGRSKYRNTYVASSLGCRFHTK